jgi:thioredoxin-dependent peroxiredoxin
LKGSETQVLAISVDDAKTVRDFARDLGASYPLLSDEGKEVSKAYGVLDPGGRVDRRVTFVVDRDGVIRKIDQGMDAVDPSGVVKFCSVLKHK